MDEVLTGLAETGYGAVEFCLEHPEASREKLFQARELGLEVSAVSYHGKNDHSKTRMNMGKRVIELAETCSVRTAVFGSPLTGEPEFSLQAQTLYTLCLEAGVKPCWETEPDTVLDSLEDFQRLIVPLGPDAGLNLDAGHLHLQGNLRRGTIGSLGSRIHHVHLEGMQKGEHRHLLPGSGDMNWEELAEGLRIAQFRGPLIIDLFELPADWISYISYAKEVLCRIIGCYLL